MLRIFALRYLAIAALLVALGAVDVAFAATTPLSDQIHRQDFGDDDGDGIPNYLDPDDNNDEIADEDTPLPDTSNPTPTAPADPVETPTAPVVPNEDPAPTQAPSTAEQPTAPQVVSLPNTGAHAQPEASSTVGLLLLSVLSSGLMIMCANRWRHLR